MQDLRTDSLGKVQRVTIQEIGNDLKFTEQSSIHINNQTLKNMASSKETKITYMLILSLNKD